MDRLDGQYEHALRVTRLLRDAKPPRDDPSGCDAAGGHVFFNPTHLCWHVLARMLVAKVSSSESGQDLRESASRGLIPHFAKTQSGFTTMGAFYDEIGAAAATDPTCPGGKKTVKAERKEHNRPSMRARWDRVCRPALPSGPEGAEAARMTTTIGDGRARWRHVPEGRRSSGPSVTMEVMKAAYCVAVQQHGILPLNGECLQARGGYAELRQPDIKVLVPCREFAERTAVMLSLAPSRSAQQPSEHSIAVAFLSPPTSCLRRSPPAESSSPAGGPFVLKHKSQNRTGGVISPSCRLDRPP